jgi:hypothetical protein
MADRLWVRHAAGMADQAPGRYWDYREARWVPYAPPGPDIPDQAQPAEETAVASKQEADVRSG